MGNTASREGFFSAAQQGDVNTLHACVRAGVDPNARDEAGWTALAYAAFQGHVAALHALLDLGADPTAADGEGNTPLHRAAVAGHVDAVGVLCDRGARVNQTNASGEPPLFVAVAQGHARAAEELLAYGASSGLVLADGTSAAHLAAFADAPDALEALIGAGADLGARNAEGQTPLHEAAAAGSLSCVALLLRHRVNEFVWDAEGRSPLELASLNNHGAVVAVLEGRSPAGATLPDAQHHPSAPLIPTVAHRRYGGSVARTGGGEGSGGASKDLGALALPQPLGLQALATVQSLVGMGLGLSSRIFLASLAAAGKLGAWVGRQPPLRGLLARWPSRSGPRGEGPRGLVYTGAGLPAFGRGGAGREAGAEGAGEGAPQGGVHVSSRDSSEDGWTVVDAAPAEGASTAAAMPETAATSAAVTSAAASDDGPALTCRAFTQEELQAAIGDRQPLAVTPRGQVMPATLADGAPAAVHIAFELVPPPFFVACANALSELRHEHLLPLLGACTNAQALVHAQPEGGTLEDSLRGRTPAGGGIRVAPLTWAQRTQLAAQVTAALAHLHGGSGPVPVLHRDLSPACVHLGGVLTPRGALHTLVGGITPPQPPGVQGQLPSGPYTAPELATTGSHTTQSDVYALGVILLQLLTGLDASGLARHARTSLSGPEGVSRAVDPCAGEVPPRQAQALADVALRCTEAHPEDRPRTAADVLGPLQNLQRQ